MPNFYLFGGPNGAGKTTAALQVLSALGSKSFLNADLIAHGLSPLDVEAAAYKSGSLLLRELRSTAEKQIDFATESTLAAHSLATNIQKW